MSASSDELGRSVSEASEVLLLLLLSRAARRTTSETTDMLSFFFLSEEKKLRVEETESGFSSTSTLDFLQKQLFSSHSPSPPRLHPTMLLIGSKDLLWISQGPCFLIAATCAAVP